MTTYEKFLKLHQQDKPFLLGNAWDVSSAKLLEENGLQAIATSSAAVANVLGYGDGEQISFAELLQVARRIYANIQLPLSVDLERGYESPLSTIAQNIDQLIEAGVVGINIEDSYREKEERSLLPAPVFSKKLQRIKKHNDEQNQQLYVNARIDTYLLKVTNPLESTLERISQYESAGASGIFVPMVTDIQEIARITASTNLPVNVLSCPGLPSFHELAKAGVRRISLGSTLFRATIRSTDHLIKAVLKDHSVDALFENL